MPSDTNYYKRVAVRHLKAIDGVSFHADRHFSAATLPYIDNESDRLLAWIAESVLHGLHSIDRANACASASDESAHARARDCRLQALRAYVQATAYAERRGCVYPALRDAIDALRSVVEDMVREL